MAYFWIFILSFALTHESWAQDSRSITLSAFTNTLKEFNYLFAYEVKRITDTDLKVIGDWQNNSAQAYSYLKTAESRIHINGGILNGLIQDEDQLRLLLCHELGHILSGRFYEVRADNKINPIEGYADFFATNYCMNQFKYDYKEIAQIAFKFSLSMAKAVSDDIFSEDERDASVAVKMNDSYSSSLCRYTTFIAGIENSSPPSCWFGIGP